MNGQSLTVRVDLSEELTIIREAKAGLWDDEPLRLTKIDVSTDPADDDTDYGPWIDRPFTAKELEAIQAAGDASEPW